MKQNKGFSLIELSIVLIIIGLLVAGVTAGNALIKTAEIRAVAREFEEHKTAVSTFRSTYDALPGDLREASLAKALGGPNALPGDGNGFIQHNNPTATGITASESLESWRQLSGANMVSGTFDQAAITTSTEAIFASGTTSTIPQSKLSGAGYFITSQVFSPNLPNLNMVFIGAYRSGSNVASMAALVPMDARNLDRKYDDGMAFSGDVFSITADPGPADSCVDMTNGNVFNLSYKDKACISSYILFR